MFIRVGEMAEEGTIYRKRRKSKDKGALYVSIAIAAMPELPRFHSREL